MDLGLAAAGKANKSKPLGLPRTRCRGKLEGGMTKSQSNSSRYL